MLRKEDTGAAVLVEVTEPHSGDLRQPVIQSWINRVGQDEAPAFTTQVIGDDQEVLFHLDTCWGAGPGAEPVRSSAHCYQARCQREHDVPAEPRFWHQGLGDR